MSQKVCSVCGKAIEFEDDLCVKDDSISVEQYALCNECSSDLEDLT